MQIVLLERVEHLGQMGQVVDVKPGYARNFLLPRKKALRATKSNVEHFENQRAQLEAHNLQRKKEAEYVAEKMTDLSITIIRQASEAGHLYGSIRSKDICDSVSQNGFSIDKSQVIIPNAIKNLGHHVVKVVLHPEVVVELKLLVAQSLEEAAAVNAKLSTQQEIIEKEETTDNVVA